MRYVTKRENHLPKILKWTGVGVVGLFVLIGLGAVIEAPVLSPKPTVSALAQPRATSPDSSAIAASSDMVTPTAEKSITSRADCPPEDDSDRDMEQHGMPSEHTICLMKADAAAQGREEEAANRGLPPKLQHRDKIDWTDRGSDAAAGNAGN